MIIDKIMDISKKSKSRVAIGTEEKRAEDIALVARRCMDMGVADVLLVSSKDVTVGEDVSIIVSESPERTLIDLLVDGDVDGIVRGSLGASSFLRVVRARYGTVNRTALLEARGHQFFLAPVGIDEGWTVEEKFRILCDWRELIEGFGIRPKVAILSGGRADDMGRNEFVDKTIDDANALLSMCKNVDMDAAYHEILIESTMDNNFVLVPDGVSGNLIYRTLVHLGSGRAYGAPYVGIDDAIVDTSRAGSVEEYAGAITLASAMAGLMGHGRGVLGRECP